MKVELWREIGGVRIEAVVGPWSFEILLLWSGLCGWCAAYSLFPARVYRPAGHPPEQTPRILAVDLTLLPFTVSIRGERAQEWYRYGIAFTDRGVEFSLGGEVFSTSTFMPGEDALLNLDWLPAGEGGSQTSTEATSTTIMSGEAGAT